MTDAIPTPSPVPLPPVSAGVRSVARGLSLFSGGLDSILAICVLRGQGCRVEAIAFDSPFFNLSSAHASAHALGIPLHVVDFTADITELVEHPPHGFGKAMNPCIDCHARMIRRAGERVREWKWDFVATGEVLNQRPMSQNRRALDQVARDSGCADLLIRPLSAKLLDATPPEMDGRVDRSRLLAIAGRSRAEQISLAEHYGIHDYPSSAGGCLLTEPMFCRKLQDLKTHEGMRDVRDLRWLRLGRHFRLPDGARCIVGRNAAENHRLQQEAQAVDLVLRPLGVPGPTVVVPGGGVTDADRERALTLCAGYCDATDGAVRLRLITDGGTREATVIPLPREAARAWML